MTSPLDEDASTASLEPTQDDNIEIYKIPAIVSWKDENDELRSLSHDASTHDHVTLDIHFDADFNTALFKITANVAYKGKRNKSNLFMFIYPERVETLALVHDDGYAPAKFGTSAYALHFTLSTPPSLIVPKGDWIPKNDASKSTLATLQAVAKKTTFHIAIPSRTLDKGRLVALCEKVSTKDCLKTPSNTTDIARLYGGKGGMTIEYGQDEAGRGNFAYEISSASLLAQAADGDHGDTKSAIDQQRSPESPPSYDELGDPPPAPPSTVRKRRRVDSDVAAGNSNYEKMSLEDICRRGFIDMGRRFDRIDRFLDHLSSRLDRVEQLALKNCLDGSSSSGQENQQPEDLGDRIDHIEERVAEVEQRLDDGLSELARDVENQICDVSHEFNDTITVRVEDEMYAAQSQLEDFVKDEIRNAAFDVEEIVREKMRDALA